MNKKIITGCAASALTVATLSACSPEEATTTPEKVAASDIAQELNWGTSGQDYTCEVTSANDPYIVSCNLYGAAEFLPIVLTESADGILGISGGAAASPETVEMVAEMLGEPVETIYWTDEKTFVYQG